MHKNGLNNPPGESDGSWTMHRKQMKLLIGAEIAAGSNWRIRLGFIAPADYYSELEDYSGVVPNESVGIIYNAHDDASFNVYAFSRKGGSETRTPLANLNLEGFSGWNSFEELYLNYKPASWLKVYRLANSLSLEATIVTNLPEGTDLGTHLYDFGGIAKSFDGGVDIPIISVWEIVARQKYPVNALPDLSFEYLAAWY